MDSRRLINVQTRLFLMIVFFTWILTAIFFALQYSRERDYKIASLDSHLQMQNAKILECIDDGKRITPQLVAAIDPGDSLRVTVIDLKGNVLYDSNGDVKVNHADRQEVKEAIATGHGFTKRRVSSTNNREYFYSATRGHGIVVRTALPYNHSLSEMLRANSVNSYIIVAIALIMSIIAWFAAHSISRSVKNLRNFANAAEFGDLSKYDSKSFPDDELGDISSHIVNLYKLQQATAEERDRNLRQAIYEQKEKNRIKHQLTNNINHEIKTPVHVIQACLETIENSGSQLDEAMRQELIDKAYANSNRLCSLIADLSVITRISDAPDQIQSAPVDVTSIVRQVADDMSVYPPEQQMRIHIEVPDGVTINGNHALVESIFRNLMVNAFNYSAGRDVTVKLVEETSDYYRFIFNDNGVGVAPDHLPHLFERFYRVDKGRSRSMGGTGLGLSIVKNAVLFHHGHIEVRNRKLGGLEFEFTLHK